LGTPEPEEKQKMRVIGLTGGIGSGKSTVAGFLAELGAVVLDLDKTGHEVLRQKGIREKLVREFGGDILNTEGEIYRSRLGEKVFNNGEALARLNAIVHPAIDALVRKQVAECERQNVEVMVLEAAAMLEAGRDWQVDEIWVTVAPEAAVLQRLSGRPGYSEADVKARIRSQMTNEKRLKQADVVIYNDGTLDELEEKVKIEWRKLRKRL
jgi:dephospho-CoA kinase